MRPGEPAPAGSSPPGRASVRGTGSSEPGWHSSRLPPRLSAIGSRTLLTARRSHCESCRSFSSGSLSRRARSIPRPFLPAHRALTSQAAVQSGIQPISKRKLNTNSQSKPDRSRAKQRLFNRISSIFVSSFPDLLNASCFRRKHLCSTPV